MKHYRTIRSNKDLAVNRTRRYIQISQVAHTLIKRIVVAVRRLFAKYQFNQFKKKIRNSKPKGIELDVFLKIAKENIGNDPAYDFASKYPEYAHFFN